jgi:hypothetical protein
MYFTSAIRISLSQHFLRRTFYAKSDNVPHSIRSHDVHPEHDGHHDGRMIAAAGKCRNADRTVH